MNSKSSPNYGPTVWDGVVAATVLLLAAVIAVLVYGASHQSGALRVVIRVGGKVADTIPLSSFPDGGVTYTNNGCTLSVGLSADGPVGGKGLGICVQHSDCPGGDCVRTGAITRAGQTIVCLPAQVVVSLEGVPDANAPDVIVG